MAITDHVELVTGFAGKAHVSSDDVAAFNQGIVGGDTAQVYRMDTAGTLLATQGTQRVVMPKSDWLVAGRFVRIDSDINIPVPIPPLGYKQRHFLYFVYQKSASGIETVSLELNTYEGYENTISNGKAYRIAVIEVTTTQIDITDQSPFTTLIPSLHNLNYQLAPVDVIETAQYGYIRSNGMLAGSAAGKVVTITVNGSNSATSSTGVVIGTVKAEYRPAVEQRTLFGVQNGSWGIIRITTAGEIMIQHMYSSSQSLTWSSFMQTITYVAA